MKKIVAVLAVVLGMASYMSAQTTNQTPNKPTFIRGTLNIKYDSRAHADSSGVPQMGYKDTYTMDINVCDSAIFYGTIVDTPYIPDGYITAGQKRSLAYDINCDVVNPNPSAAVKRLNVGRIYGSCPVSPAGVYQYNAGNVVCDILSLGRASGFTSKFDGTCAGKPSLKNGAVIDKTPKVPVTITKNVNGKTVKILVKNYDKMTFTKTKVCSGPVAIYQEVILDGTMIYDYQRFVWYFNNLTVSYVVNGQQLVDHLSGNIRWVEDKNRDSNGLGEYQFDVRVNEPPATENSVFGNSDTEASFFEADTTVPSLGGTMKYKDTMNSDKTTLSSAVTIDLNGNNITKQQAMVLCKALMFLDIVPFNAD